MLKMKKNIIYFLKNIKFKGNHKLFLFVFNLLKNQNLNFVSQHLFLFEKL